MRQSRAVESEDHMEDQDDVDEDDDGTGAAARLKTYIKAKATNTQEVLDRRSRKNQQSRARAAKLRHRILEIEAKHEDERTEEEMHIWQQYEQRRQRKNNRSRERALEKKEEIDRILAKPDKKRTKIEKQFLETALAAKKRKNEGDRLRRQRLKELGLSTKGTGIRPGISARGPLPTQYQHLLGAPPPSGPPGHASHHPHHHPAHHPHPAYHPHHYPGYPPGAMPPPYGAGGGEIPMSPLPPHHHPQGPQHMHGQSMPSPPAYGSHGGYHSPQRRGTPGRSEGGPPMAYMPPGPPDAQDEASRVEERQNPDGSTTISVQPTHSDATEEAVIAEEDAHGSEAQGEAQDGDVDGTEETPAEGEAQEGGDYDEV